MIDDKISEKINAQYDKYITQRVSDTMLMSKYHACPSCKKVMNIFEETARDIGVSGRQKRLMEKRLLPLLIPLGVKASVRGAVLNKYIQSKISNIQKATTFIKSAIFEPRNVAYPHISEIPDWVVETTTGKLVIGFNQLDLWNGGAQINRGSKYIMDETLHRRLGKHGMFIVCVVARRYVFSKQEKRTKADNIVFTGSLKNRLVWPKGLKAVLEKMNGI